MATIGFIGLGKMGLPMAVNLVKAGHEVRGFDLSQAALEEFGAAGGTVAGSVADAVTGAAVIVTMLPAGSHVRDILTRADGVFAHAESGCLADR